MTHPIFLCTMRNTHEGVDHGNIVGSKAVVVFFNAVDPITVGVDGARPLLTGVGEFALEFKDSNLPLAAQYEPGKLYRLVPV